MTAEPKPDVDGITQASWEAACEFFDMDVFLLNYPVHRHKNALEVLKNHRIRFARMMTKRTADLIARMHEWRGEQIRAARGGSEEREKCSQELKRLSAEMERHEV